MCNDKAFKVYAVITDIDLMEHGALVIVFPQIWLLICKFHLRQAWRNHQNKLLKGKMPVLFQHCHGVSQFKMKK